MGRSWISDGREGERRLRTRAGWRASLGFGMWTLVRRTARLFCWRELHKLDAGLIWIVQIQLPFAIAADLRLLFGGESARHHAVVGRVNILHADGDVVHHAEGVLVRVWRHVQHVFDPVGAV